MGGGLHIQRRRRAWAALIGSVAVLASACGFEEPAIQPITVETLTHIEIPPIAHKVATLDMLAIDSSTRRIYAADLTDLGLDVIDLSRSPGSYTETINLGVPPNGVVIAPDLHEIFTGNDDSTVSVVDIDPASPAKDSVVASLNTGGDGPADLIEYDPKDHKVFVTNPDDGFVSIIDATTRHLDKRIDNLGVIDQPRYDPVNGLVYVSGSDQNVLYVIDPRSEQLVKTLHLDVPCQPHGIAINPRTNQGILGCSNKDEPHTVVWDFGRDQMIRVFDQAGAGDAVVFDSRSGHFYFAAKDYYPAEVAVFSGSPPITFLTAVPTSHSSRSVVYDYAHRALYAFDGRFGEVGLWSFPDPVAGHA